MKVKILKKALIVISTVIGITAPVFAYTHAEIPEDYDSGSGQLTSFKVFSAEETEFLEKGGDIEELDAVYLTGDEAVLFMEESQRQAMQIRKNYYSFISSSALSSQVIESYQTNLIE